MSDAALLPPLADLSQSASGPHHGVDVAEYVGLVGPKGEIVITETEDGGAYVDMPGEERNEQLPTDTSFYSNLAEVLPDTVRSTIATDLLRRIDDDMEARKKHDEAYEEGIKRTGLGKDAPGGADFEGASKVVHPMLSEACVDYQARAMRELFPPAGPVKPRLIGKATAEKTSKAQRVTDHMNWQATTQIKELRSTIEVMLSQVPLVGAQYLRMVWDHRLKRPTVQFAAADKVVLPGTATSFHSATRRTFIDTISSVDFQMRVDQGMYLDLDLAPPSMLPDETKAEKASQKIEGVDRSAQNIDGDRVIYETMAYLEITDDVAAALDGQEQEGEVAPYLITVDVSSKQMLSMYRCWEANDTAREPIEHLFEFIFLPWRSPYGIGLTQLIGGMSAAATGALRALLDSAHANNALGGYILKGSGAGGQSKRPAIGELCEIDTGLEADDIRKKILPFSVGQPSTVLFQLLGFLVEAAKGVVRTSMDDSPGTANGQPTPVGTQMSRVEEGMVVFSAVFGRAHAALDRFLAGLHRLNRLYLPEVLKVDADGQEIFVKRSDYEGPVDVQPVSSPNIYSDTQRFNQVAYIQVRAALAPQLWDLRAVELMGLKLLKIPDPESLLAPPTTAKEMNAVDENVAMALGKPVAAFPLQDHLAHLQVLLDFAGSQALGQNPVIAPRYLVPAVAHAAEHIVYAYAQIMSDTVTNARKAAGADVNEELANDDAVKRSLDQLFGTASRTVVPEMATVLGGALPLLGQIMQAAQQFVPKPPMDPATAAVQAAAAETQRRAAADQANAANDQQANAIKAEAVQVQADRVQAMRESAQVAAQTKITTTGMNNETAEEIAGMEASANGKTNFTDGASLSKP
jgi:hypothetical protein